MYQRYCELNNWRFKPVSCSEAEKGGYKTFVMEVKGKQVYSKLKFESGVHRVQRVPQTETMGRVHTSTATVAIMPEADEVDVVIDPKDIELKAARSGGAGDIPLLECVILLVLYSMTLGGRMLTRWRRLLILFTSLRE